MSLLPRALAALCLLLPLLLPATARALDAGWAPVHAAELDRQRGGFTGIRGLHVSLGIERLVTINGDVVARTHLAVRDIGTPGAGQAVQTGATLSAPNLVQNGGDNMVLGALGDGMLPATIIQNTLDHQHIRSQTIINASVNSGELLKTINFQGSLGDALARAAGPR
ncbi:MAG: hypothetical protein V4633_06755 [Pseudomonadota bacterium]